MRGKKSVENLDKNIRRLCRDLVRHPALKYIAHDLTSTDQFREFAVQRHILAAGFVDLLTAIVSLSSDQTLVACINSNVHDETGGDNPKQSHAHWREDYLHALGVADTASSLPFSGTTVYADCIKQLITAGDALACAGAILALEWSIPLEFKQIQHGRDRLFPEKFLDRADDTPEQLEKKRKARLYLNDHILHDAASHYPDLLHVLKQHEADTPTMAHITHGANIIIHTKISFYDSAATHLFKLPLPAAP